MLCKFHLLLSFVYFLSILYHSCADVGSPPRIQRAVKDARTKQAEKEWAQLEINKKTLQHEKRTDLSTEMTDVIRLNVGGEIIVTTRQSLTVVAKSVLAKLFHGRWEKIMSHDEETNVFLDFHPLLFRHLLEQLRQTTENLSHRFTPPRSSSPFAVQSFNRMLKALGLDRSLSSTNEMVVMNVGGDRILTRQKSLNASRSVPLILLPSEKMMTNGLVVDADPWLFRYLLGQLREQKASSPLHFRALSAEKMKSMNRMLSSFGLDRELSPMTTKMTTTEATPTTDPTMNQRSSSIPPYPACWETTAVTVAGSRGFGNKRDKLNTPHGLFVDEDQTVYIADYNNHRVMAWKEGATTGEVVAGGNGEGKRLDQLKQPSDVIVDRKTDTLLICDWGNRRVMRWPRLSSSSVPPQGETVIGGIWCGGLAMDAEGALYVSVWQYHEVRRYDKDDYKTSTVVAGGDERGDKLNQLEAPSFLFLDAQSTLYVSDSQNHRVMAWKKGATEGIVVAGGNGQGEDLTQLYLPKGVWVDGYGHVYVADEYNHRVMRWEKGAKQGTVIVGGNGAGAVAHQLYSPIGLFFDRHGDLYVADEGNHRVQRFSMI